MSDFDSNELADLIAKYCDQILSDDERIRLEGMLQQSEDARREFIERVDFHTRLQTLGEEENPDE